MMGSPRLRAYDATALWSQILLGESGYRLYILLLLRMRERPKRMLMPCMCASILYRPRELLRNPGHVSLCRRVRGASPFDMGERIWQCRSARGFAIASTAGIAPGALAPHRGKSSSRRYRPGIIPFASWHPMHSETGT